MTGGDFDVQMLAVPFHFDVLALQDLPLWWPFPVLLQCEARLKGGIWVEAQICFLQRLCYAFRDSMTSRNRWRQTWYCL